MPWCWILSGNIFSNGKAGLFDLDLNKVQKQDGAQAGLYQFKDYGVMIFVGIGQPGQSPEQVKDLIMGEIEKLKKGDFDETLVKAIVANGKLDLLQGLQKNESRVGDLMESFIQTRATKWDSGSSRCLDEQAKVSKQGDPGGGQ